MSKEKTIKVCTGIGLNMFFPDYVEVTIPTDNDDVEGDVNNNKEVKRKRKNKKDE